MATYRSESDSMGAIDVPADKLWGAQTQRSLEHFRISTEKMPAALIHALALTKRASAVNGVWAVKFTRMTMLIKARVLTTSSRRRCMWRPLSRYAKN